jgi:hypothetical protein
MPQDRELLFHAPPGEKSGRTLAAYQPLSVAREPRKVRQTRLGNSLWSVQQ